ncbi:hypothetical protein D3C81_1353710 [compost metagenome]
MHIGVPELFLRPTNTNGAPFPALAIQAHAEADLLADEYRHSAQRGQAQPAEIAVGMQDGNEEQRQQQEGQAVGQAVLVVDRGEQHQHQSYAEGDALQRGNDEDAPLIELQ